MSIDKKTEKTVEKVKYLLGLNGPKGIDITDVKINIEFLKDKSEVYQYDVMMQIIFADFPGVEEIELHLHIIKTKISKLVETYRISKSGDLVVDSSLEDVSVYSPVIVGLTTGFQDSTSQDICTYSVLFNVILD